MSNRKGIELIGQHVTPEGGTVRLQKWPEGYVLWYHGEIVWRSFDWPRKVTEGASK